jgi:hypothetical protein
MRGLARTPRQWLISAAGVAVREVAAWRNASGQGSRWAGEKSISMDQEYQPPPLQGRY